MGVQILGVSTDEPEANRAFAEKYRFPFPLLSDLERRVCLAYGTCDRADERYARRITYLIDTDGRILYVHERIDPTRHADEVLESIESCSCSLQGTAQGVGPSGGPEASGNPPRRLAYAVGEIGFTYESAARRDSFVQAGLADPYDSEEVLAFLAQHPPWAAALVWTLAQETIPLYALRAPVPFAAQTYADLRQILGQQLAAGIAQVAVPGRIDGTQQMVDGRALPVLWVELRGVEVWRVRPPLEDPAMQEEVHGFLARVFYELRNAGVSPEDRAVNFAATRAVQLATIYRSALADGMRLEAIAVERSPLCRPGSDCWDVQLAFFDPSRRLERAREVYRLTVDVSDIVPVQVGGVRHWAVD